MKKIKKLLITILCFVFSISLSSCDLFNSELDPSTFDDYTNDIFYMVVGADELTNNFLFKNPENYGLPKIGELMLPVPTTNSAIGNFIIKQVFKDLYKYDYNKLSFDQQMTYNVLDNLYKNIMNETDEMTYLGSNYLGSYLGYQAQLPLLFSEYKFDDVYDVYNYFGLIDLVPETFESYVNFEIEKAEEGYGMPDFVIDKVINQCKEFIDDVDNHFLIKTFEDRIKNLDLTGYDTTKEDLIQENYEKVTGPLKEGYEYIKNNLGQLYGKATNNLGLYYYKEGQEYYTKLFKDETGYDVDIEDAITYIDKKLNFSYNELQSFVKNNPDILDEIESSSLMNTTPEEQINNFIEISKGIFPTIESYPTINIKYIDKSIENHFSPAAYLNSRIDDYSNEYIYLNNASIDGDYNYLFHTLAHEGIPGHLYQNVYFKTQNANILRKIIKSSGYTEGWATYVEMYSFSFCDEEHKDLAEYIKLDNLFYGSLQCRLDMGIHYEGWDANDILEFISKYLPGYSLEHAQAVLEQLIEVPTNSQIYFFTYFKIQDMYDRTKLALGDNFSELEFHQLILDCGPVPLRFVETIVDEYINKKIN
ncbi:MAG: DUF885 domain-containing protein [Bacilli bacterium]|nr:DUF885 domain-containing protein [Bacilli bacterium]